jgi:hypothetical protein
VCYRTRGDLTAIEVANFCFAVSGGIFVPFPNVRKFRQRIGEPVIRLVPLLVSRKGLRFGYVSLRCCFERQHDLMQDSQAVHAVDGLQLQRAEYLC